MKKFAFVNYAGTVMSIETRCSCLYKKDKLKDEIALEDVIAADFLNYYVEIPDGIIVTEGMLYSNGEFKENPVAPSTKVTMLEERVSATEDALLTLMMM